MTEAEEKMVFESLCNKRQECKECFCNDLCKECRSVIYKAIKTRTTMEKLKHFNTLALNIKMKKNLEG